MAQGPVTSGGCRQKLLLRPWLVEKIGSGSIPGLRWVDEEAGIFRMTWRRVNTEGWTPADSQLLMEWAKHKDRYSKGKEDYSKWKTQLRCAFNKANIVELKEQSRTQAGSPYKVFHMSPLSGNPRYSHQESDVTSTTAPSAVDSPSSMATDEHYGTRSNQSNLNIPCTQAAGAIPADIPLAVEQMSCSSTEDIMDISASDLNIPVADIQDMLNQEATPMTFTQEDFDLICSSVVDNSILLQIQYRGLTVFEKTVQNQNGLRLSFLSQRCIDDDGVFEQIYGPSTLEDITLPFSDGLFMDEQKRQSTLEILQQTDRGVQLESNDQGIFATRRCRLTVYFASSLTNGHPQKLPRKERVQIFDRNQFLDDLTKYSNGGCQGPKPNILVRLGFGQKLSLSHNTKHTYVAVNIISQSAYTFLATYLQNSPTPDAAVVDEGHISQSLPADMSNETETDFFVRKLQELSIKKK